MKGLSTDKHGRHKYQFRRPDNDKRDGFRLGRIPRRAAEEIARHVGEILIARRSGGRIPDATATWLGTIPRELVQTLIGKSIIDASMAQAENRPTSLSAFLDLFMEKVATNKKPNTRRQLELTRKYLLLFFGKDKDLAAITAGEADDFREWLGKDAGKSKKALAENTIRRQCSRAKQIFRNALRRRLISENPFADMRGIQVTGNPERQAFIHRPVIMQLIDACPNAEWRLLVALARFAGLRIPSEIRFLKWSHIDWAKGRMLVTSPKTERHPGGESRYVPIFPELRPYLEEAADAADDGAEFVIATPHYRHERANLRTPLLKILAKARIEPWPKPFQNLRSTCETELLKNHLEWKVVRWVGNSKAVAREHYYQMTDADYQEACGFNWPGVTGDPWLKNGSAEGSKRPHGVAANANHSDIHRDYSRKERETRPNPSHVNIRPMPRLGLEPRTL